MVRKTHRRAYGGLTGKAKGFDDQGCMFRLPVPEPGRECERSIDRRRKEYRDRSGRGMESEVRRPREILPCMGHRSLAATSREETEKW
jgi:hypothetical protein